ncbi:winged helix-turn-helix domain-containing protein [Halobacterium sp. KA-4]|uniref:winged helix-turn-helix domain-containing protein n=1 Tax=Halobacterium sp. KA-4 TaxID=2896367 RepID=UPI001E2EE941|nr:winged helix-turn-helix domain-containing protein [Halobacterium sp. KA-4]MCD2200903.1 winged helix-turn-helix domain-containing protein [Halobacterium sp. KA-4]
MDLNETDQLILAKLREGRCTPRYLADELTRNKSYVSQRLRHLQDEGYVDRVHRGLYRLTAVDPSHVSADELVESCEPEELVSPCEDSSQYDSTANEVPSEISSLRIEFGTDDIPSVASRVCQSGTDEEQLALESLIHDILWVLIQDGELPGKALRTKIKQLNDLDVVDFRDIHQYKVAITNRLTDHPQISVRRNSRSRDVVYTGESPVVRL